MKKKISTAHSILKKKRKKIKTNKQTKNNKKNFNNILDTKNSDSWYLTHLVLLRSKAYSSVFLML